MKNNPEIHRLPVLVETVITKYPSFFVVIDWANSHWELLGSYYVDDWTPADLWGDESMIPVGAGINPETTHPESEISPLTLARVRRIVSSKLPSIMHLPDEHLRRSAFHGLITELSAVPVCAAPQPPDVRDTITALNNRARVIYPRALTRSIWADLPGHTRCPPMVIATDWAGRLFGPIFPHSTADQVATTACLFDFDPEVQGVLHQAGLDPYQLLVTRMLTLLAALPREDVGEALVGDWLAPAFIGARDFQSRSLFCAFSRPNLSSIPAMTAPVTAWL